MLWLLFAIIINKDEDLEKTSFKFLEVCNRNKFGIYPNYP